MQRKRCAGSHRFAGVAFDVGGAFDFHVARHLTLGAHLELLF
jgi:hypothetical protein